MRIGTLMMIAAAPLALVACDSGDRMAGRDDMPMADREMPMADSPMPMMNGGGAMQTARAEGTVTAIDAEAGTITIAHGPVPAIDWPAMTMAFDANTQLREQVTVGEEIAFEFQTGAERNIINSIAKE